jgi:hypothetical protein
MANEQDTPKKSFDAASPYFEVAMKLAQDRHHTKAVEAAKQALEYCPEEDTSGLREQILSFLRRLQS